MRPHIIVAVLLGLVTAWAVAETPQCKDFEKAVTLDQASCNGHGTLYPDTGVCECWSPYEGSKCEKQSTQPGAIDVGVGDLSLFYQYWERSDVWAGTASIAIPSWYRPDYLPPPVLISPFRKMYPILELVQKEIFKMHKWAGNAVTDGYTIVLGNGATQLVRALLAGISQTEGRPFSVFAQSPCYPNFIDWGNENPLRSVWNASLAQNPRNVVEIVTSPSNPLGTAQQPYYTNAAYVLWDLVYYWPYNAGLKMQPLNEDIMMFSLSKMTGHAQSRFGWALVKNATLAQSMMDMLSLDSYGVSVDSMYRAYQLLSHLNNEWGAAEDFFYGSAEVLAARWTQLQALFAKQSAFTIHSAPGSVYAWVECPANLTNGACNNYFTSFGINGRYGSGEMGGPSNFIRFNLAVRNDTFAAFLPAVTNALEHWQAKGAQQAAHQRPPLKPLEA